ncbi:hypothetical protein MRB53_013698 [Persea americana]|uniref:Uncharacterized protein n=1 Tax=Persea americana TaxID=3435 RepID=A0ACC2K941_PERAE|nr:hypothetical protein MRB53_013698 [Persea americana]
MSALVNIQCRKVKPPNSYDDIFGDMFFLDGPPAEQYGSEPRDRRLTDGAASAFGDRSCCEIRDRGGSGVYPRQKMAPLSPRSSRLDWRNIAAPPHLSPPRRCQRKKKKNISGFPLPCFSLQNQIMKRKKSQVSGFFHRTLPEKERRNSKNRDPHWKHLDLFLRFLYSVILDHKTNLFCVAPSLTKSDPIFSRANRVPIDFVSHWFKQAKEPQRFDGDLTFANRQHSPLILTCRKLSPCFHNTKLKENCPFSTVQRRDLIHLSKQRTFV